MARVRDWVGLADQTVRSLKASDVTNFYSLEWPSTKQALIADHASDIEREPRRLRRWIRTTSALVYGLAKRLAPHRRVVFVVALLLVLFSLFGRLDIQVEGHTIRAADHAASAFTGFCAFLLVTLLLAMELIDKLRFRDELVLARELQASLLPSELPSDDTWDFAATNVVANTVGGDLYDFVRLPDDRVAVIFGDASGHGMTAGLVMAVAHAGFRTQLEIDPSPASIVGALNRILCRAGGPRSFFSCAYLLLETDGRFQSVFAGHPPPLHVDRSGHLLQRLGSGSYPLGIKEQASWPVVDGALGDGDAIVLYSDGLVEARTPEGRDYGYDRVESFVGAQIIDNSSEIVRRMRVDWEVFTGGRPAEDDVSVAVIRRR